MAFHFFIGNVQLNLRGEFGELRFQRGTRGCQNDVAARAAGDATEDKEIFQRIKIREVRDLIKTAT